MQLWIAAPWLGKGLRRLATQALPQGPNGIPHQGVQGRLFHHTPGPVRAPSHCLAKYLSEAVGHSSSAWPPTQALHTLGTFCTVLSFITGCAEQLQWGTEVAPPGAVFSSCNTATKGRSIVQRAQHELASMQDSRRVKKPATCPQSSTGRAGLSAPPRAILRCSFSPSSLRYL